MTRENYITPYSLLLLSSHLSCLARNRFDMNNVKVYEADITDFVSDSGNANLGTERGAEMIRASLQEVGAGRSLVADKHGVIAAGNKTQVGLINSGFNKAIVVESDGTRPVIVKRTDFDLSDPDPNNPARKYAFFDNRASDIGLVWSPEQIKFDLNAGLDLSAMFEEGEIAEILAGLAVEELPVAPDAQVDKAEELQRKWRVKRGDLWIIGNHRLMCGDSTCAENVEQLTSGKKVGAVVTDPPYGCTDLEWDRYPAQNDLDLWLSVSDGAVVAFGAAPPRCLHALLSLKPQPERIYVWWNTFTLTHSEGAFWQWQPIYVWRRSAFRGLERDVIQMAANTGGDELFHITQKPTELVRNLIQATEGDIADFFLGSGTTMVAAQQLGRRCFGMEICEKYVAVSLQRLQDMGLEPRLVEP